MTKYRVYLYNTEEALPRRNGSVVWKALCQVWSQVLNGCRWVVGNGAKIRFWRDCWLMDEPFMHLAIQEISEGQLLRKMKELGRKVFF